MATKKEGHFVKTCIREQLSIYSFNFYSLYYPYHAEFRHHTAEQAAFEWILDRQMDKYPVHIHTSTHTHIHIHTLHTLCLPTVRNVDQKSNVRTRFAEVCYCY